LSPEIPGTSDDLRSNDDPPDWTLTSASLYLSSDLDGDILPPILRWSTTIDLRPF